MKEITSSNLLDYEFVHLTCSNETIDYYYVEFSNNTGIQVSIEGDIIEVDLVILPTITDKVKSIHMPEIKYMEDLLKLALFMSVEEEIK